MNRPVDASTAIVCLVQEMTDKRHGCHNRPPLRDAITVQDGWTEDGRKITKQMPHVMSRDCRHDLRQTDPGCAGCKNIGDSK